MHLLRWWAMASGTLVLPPLSYLVALSHTHEWCSKYIEVPKKKTLGCVTAVTESNDIIGMEYHISPEDDHVPFPWASSSGASASSRLFESEKQVHQCRLDCSTSSILRSNKELSADHLEKHNENCRPAKKRKSPSETWMDVFSVHANAIPELVDVQQECEDSVPGRIIFQLPGLGALAGNVLSHSVNVLETLFKCWDPLIFKIGWTHHPAWRWSNSIYGYGHAKERWGAMIVFYYSLEPHGPAMLEASLIDKFMSTLVCNEWESCFIFLYASLIVPVSTFPRFSLR